MAIKNFQLEIRYRYNPHVKSLVAMAVPLVETGLLRGRFPFSENQ